MLRYTFQYNKAFCYVVESSGLTVNILIRLSPLAPQIKYRHWPSKALYLIP